MYLFCYGVLLNIKIWEEFEELRLKPRFQCRACLEGYQLIFDGQSKRRPGATGNIRQSKGKIVWGALFEITEKDLPILDKYEGVPTIYQRKLVSVKDDTNRMHNAWVYYRTDQPVGKPSRQYMADMIEGAQACQLPQEYIQTLQEIKTYENK